MEIFSKILKGHSGCIIKLINDSQKIQVYKISPSKEYNFRLKKQCLKQAKFQSKDIKAPIIYKSGYLENKFYFSMEYVKGKTFAEHFNNIDVNKIPDLLNKLFNNLYIQNSQKNKNSNKIFLKKIQTLKTQLYNYDFLKQSFDILENFEWENVSKSPCHGDLTLENILISQDGQIYLIDFLDSFYNSWMFDIAKLLQDLEIKWSFREQANDSNRDLRLFLAKKALLNEFNKIENANTILITIYHLLLLNILRIYPYTKDYKTINFLNNAIENVVKEIYKRQKEVCL